MQSTMNKSRQGIMDTLFQEFNGHSVYGLELVLDELYENAQNESAQQGADHVDWFGLSDLSI